MAMQQKKMSIFKSSQQRFKDKPTSITSQLFYEGSNN